MPEDKTEQVLKIIRQWVREHGYGDLCILIKCHQGEAVGVEDVKDKTKRIVRI